MDVLMPLPDHDYDTTEVAVPWKLLTEAGHRVTFATETGRGRPECDPRLLTGVVFGQLGADPEPLAFYRELLDSPELAHPVSWADVDVTAYDGLLLAGGHAAGMRQYLGSSRLQEQVGRFWATDRPVGAICHGPVVLARSTDPRTGAGVLAGRTTTGLPKRLERAAFAATAWRLGRYYRTYPTYVQDEITAAVGESGHFEAGPRTRGRGTRTDHTDAFVVTDGSYVSARWPGDSYLFAQTFLSQLDAAELATTRVATARVDSAPATARPATAS